MRTALVLAAVAVSLVGTQSTPSLTPTQWKDDVAYFARELPKRHANAFHRMTRDQFDSAIRQLQLDLPSLAAHEIPVRMLQITAHVGDGHTYVRLPRTFHVLPIAVSYFEQTLRVASATAEHADLLGAEVKAINGVPISEVRTRAKSLLSGGENAWFELANLPATLAQTEVLNALRITTAPDRAEITFSVNGRDITRTLMGQARDTLQLAPPTGTLPLHRQRPADSFWFGRIPDSAGLFVAFRGYDDFGKHARALLAALDNQRPSFVVVDLRQNPGGDFTKPREQLLPGLKSRGYVGDRLYVITGRRTFSAAMVNAIDFRNLLRATLVGEPPGETPNSYQENDAFTLPNSKILVSYSTKYYKFLAQDAPAVMPDELIEPTWEAFASGRDQALEWILGRAATLSPRAR